MLIDSKIVLKELLHFLKHFFALLDRIEIFSIPIVTIANYDCNVSLPLVEVLRNLIYVWDMFGTNNSYV